MDDIIQLLPDHVANQIAAGEVIQRPASAVKELLENAVDAGANQITLILKDAGRTSIQVVDNGKGMSYSDARMSFERHATSKIRSADDLFKISTKGFRGEALASIAAIAHVELRTRRPMDELGNRLEIEGSEVKAQEHIQHNEGTSISVKNLFYNVPARRNFLKGDKVELRHVIDEFERVALAHPDRIFRFFHNEVELFHLPEGNLRQRLVNVFGKNLNDKLVPVEEDAHFMKISGYVVKPIGAKRKRGEQFFFVNQRFIKSGFLHHAVSDAFKELLAPDQYPGYFLFLDVDPAFIDVNIHPTKTEIKFEDEHSVHAVLRSAVKKSLGQYNIAPTLDFNIDPEMAHMNFGNRNMPNAPTIEINPNYNPFNSSESNGNGHAAYQKPNASGWENLFPPSEDEWQEQEELPLEGESGQARSKLLYQMDEKYILTHLKSGMLAIHQQRAHERILFEQFQKTLSSQSPLSQQLLFEQTLSFSAGDSEIIRSRMGDLSALGFDIEEFGSRDFVVRGVPSGVDVRSLQRAFDEMLEAWSNQKDKAGTEHIDRLARTAAAGACIKKGQALSYEEMEHLIDELFACQMPYVSPGGKPTVITISTEDLDKQFNA